jgi:hypothetical protein
MAEWIMRMGLGDSLKQRALVELDAANDGFARPSQIAIAFTADGETGQLRGPFRLQLRGVSGHEDHHGASPGRPMTAVEIRVERLEDAPRQTEMSADARASMASGLPLR